MVIQTGMINFSKKYHVLNTGVLISLPSNFKRSSFLITNPTNIAMASPPSGRSMAEVVKSSKSNIPFPKRVEKDFVDSTFESRAIVPKI